jgi:alpha-glucosidase (family GH31 glycosyl hydrolase)
LRDARRRGCPIRFATGAALEPSQLGGGLDRCRNNWVDPFKPAARELPWKYLDDAFLSAGIDAGWQDATEPGDDGNTVIGHAMSVRLWLW